MSSYSKEQASDIVCGGNENCGEIRVTPNGDTRRVCIANRCSLWRWLDDAYEVCRTDNRTPDFETMQERTRTHPTERLIWMRPEGEPLPPPGEGWVKVNDMRQTDGFAPGVFEQWWQRPRVHARGYCGLGGPILFDYRD